MRPNESTSDCKRTHVIQGEHAVSEKPDEVLLTILGSCVATCLYDPLRGVGGMNHFLLPGRKQSTGSDSDSYGLNAMELLINGLLKLGARRERLEAKIFGGARMIDGLSDIGEKNATFATEFLSFEGIPCISQSLGGAMARRVRFWPTTGRVQLKLLGEAQIVAPVRVIKPSAPIASDVELF